MFPAIVPVEGEIDLNERTPFGAFGFSHQAHASLEGCAVGLAGVATDAGADDVFPGRGSAPVAGHHVVQVQILAVKYIAAVLAGVLIAFKNVVPCEFDLFFGHAIVHEEEDDPGDADAKRDAVDGIFMRGIGGNIAPLGKIEGSEGTVWIVQNHLGMALEEEGEGSSSRADIDSLPKPVQYQYMLVEGGVHQVQAGEGYQGRLRWSMIPIQGF